MTRSSFVAPASSGLVLPAPVHHNGSSPSMVLSSSATNNHKQGGASSKVQGKGVGKGGRKRSSSSAGGRKSERRGRVVRQLWVARVDYYRSSPLSSGALAPALPSVRRAASPLPPNAKRAQRLTQPQLAERSLTVRANGYQPLRRSSLARSVVVPSSSSGSGVSDSEDERALAPLHLGTGAVRAAGGHCGRMAALVSPPRAADWACSPVAAAVGITTVVAGPRKPVASLFAAPAAEMAVQSPLPTPPHDSDAAADHIAPRSPSPAATASLVLPESPMTWALPAEAQSSADEGAARMARFLAGWKTSPTTLV